MSIAVPATKSSLPDFMSSAAMPLYAADKRDWSDKSLRGAKFESVMVRGSEPPSIHFKTCGKSKAKRVSLALPYSSPNTPHQNQRETFSFTEYWSIRSDIAAQMAANGTS